MRQEPMIAQADPQPAGDPGKRKAQHNALTGENERRRKGTDMDQGDPEDRGPTQVDGPAIAANCDLQALIGSLSFIHYPP